MRASTVSFLLVGVFVVINACGKRAETEEPAVEPTRIPFSTATSVPTATPTPLPPSAPQFSGLWKHYVTSTTWDWTMNVVDSGTAAAGTVQYSPNASFSVTHQYNVNRMTSSVYQGPMRISYSTTACVDTLDAEWTLTAQNEMWIDVWCVSCYCGIISPYLHIQFPVYR